MNTSIRNSQRSREHNNSRDEAADFKVTMSNNYIDRTLKQFKGIIFALRAAISGVELSFYPRSNKDEKLDVKVIIPAINDRLAKLKCKDVDDAKIKLGLAQESYKEVKAATEYQDQKTARLLTISAFLTAATGAVFSKTLDIYPLDFTSRPTFHSLSLILVYFLFFLFFFFIATGALVSFYAMQTRFVFNEQSDFVTDNGKSLLFFKYISATTPDAWALNFNKPSVSLLETYIKHYVVETYLIAAKTSDKVRFLQPAQDALQYGIRVLLGLMLFLLLVVCIVPRTKNQPPSTIANPLYNEVNSSNKATPISSHAASSIIKSQTQVEASKQKAKPETKPLSPAASSSVASTEAVSQEMRAKSSQIPETNQLKSNKDSSR